MRTIMTKKTDLSKEIISATLILAANRPWQKISMNNIAEAAKIEPDILARIFGSKQSILNTFNHQIDEEIKTRFLNDQDKDSIRDQIFEIANTNITITMQDDQSTGTTSSTDTTASTTIGTTTGSSTTY